MDDATYKDASGTATFNAKETAQVTATLSQVGSMFQKINANQLRSFLQLQEEFKGSLAGCGLKTYNNTKVRAGEKITNTRQHTRGLIAFVYDKLKKEVDKVKREETKKNKQQVMDLKMKFFRSNSSQLVKIFDMQNLLVDAKEFVIRKLEKAKGVMDTFVRTDKGYRVTQPEGFVAVDKVGKAVKLVDRLEFAHQNFTAAKNWTK